MTRRLILVTWIVLALGCANKKLETAVPKQDGDFREHRVTGQVRFFAQYTVRGKKAPPSDSDVPRGDSPVRFTRICAYEKHGRNDFRHFKREVNDNRLGCADTDAEGGFDFRFRQRCPKVGLCEKWIYLVTDLCSWKDGKPELCVTANTKQGKRLTSMPWTKYVEFRKFMWSETVQLSLDHRSSTIVSWNLSCPHEPGEGRPSLRCTKPQPEGRYGRKNSNYGWNVDAVHVLQAGVQSIARFGSLLPTQANTQNAPGEHCAGPRSEHEKDSVRCRDAIRLIISNLRKITMEGDKRCGRWLRGKNEFRGKRTACIASPLNPFIIAHEVGHIVHVRWMNYKGGINAGRVDWNTGTDQKSMTAEGWADFFSAATWYPRDALRPGFNDRNIEDPNDPGMQGSCALGTATGESRPAQFFWDLYDTAKESEPQDEVSVDFWTLLRVWSTFRGKQVGHHPQDKTRGECNPHGRNIKDYLYYYDRFSEQLPDASALVPHNCLSTQLDGMRCD